MQPTLYNARTKKFEVVTPLDSKTLRIYSCGPTVYDHAHIGNLASFIFADTLRRMLQAPFAGRHQVKHVMNFTDVDDKTIRRSQQDYPDDAPEVALQNLTRQYERLFISDMQAVGNDVDALNFVRATDSITDIQALIAKLYEQKIAYIADDGVYFSLAQYQKTRVYGQLSEVSTARTSAARINNDEYDKEFAHDFSLWKTQKTGEPSWEFSLGGHNLAGRPGWHIECSAMSVSHLGQPFDIHTGGIDLQFPHHENEIAQSTAGDQPALYANFFCYNEHILVDGKKMSKSLNNFYTLVDVLEHGFDPIAFRLLVLQSHYRNQLNFSWESLQAAQNRLRDLQAMADLRFQIIDADGPKPQPDYTVHADALRGHMLNDLQTPKALATLSNAATDAQEGIFAHNRKEFMNFLRLVDDLLGLNLLGSSDITEEQKQLIHKRQQARQRKDWAESDTLRDILQRQGIILRDTAERTLWYRM